MKRATFIPVSLGLALLVGVWVVGRGNSQTSTLVSGADTYRSDEIAANGLVEGASPEVALRPEVTGTIRVIAFRENQQVRKGDVLIELENEVQKQQVAVASAELAQAEAELERVRNGERAEKRQALAAQAAAKKVAYELTLKQWQRAQKLVTTSSISREEYDNAEHRMQSSKEEWNVAVAEHALVEAPARKDEMDVAGARVAAARARWHLAQAELAKTRVCAPCAGCILQVFAEPGDQAGPTTKQPVLLFADLSITRVRAFVEELDATQVHAGQQATVTVDGMPGKIFQGTLKLVLPRMGKRAPHTDNSGEFHDLYYREVLIELNNGGGLLVGLRTMVRIGRGS